VRSLLKRLLSFGVRLVVLPELVRYGFLCLFLDRDKAFHGSSQALSRWPGVGGEYVRREFYRLTLDACSEDCCISFGTILSKRGARIGRGVYIGTGCTLGLVTIEDDVLIASNVDVLSGSKQHHIDDLDTPVREQGGTFERVTIGEDTWIGNRAIVMADVGRQCVVGAGSVVSKPLRDRSLAVGSPARAVGIRGGAAAAEEDA
jgi:acetyltransferase-like isoleucine patch superfamily enzyme